MAGSVEGVLAQQLALLAASRSQSAVVNAADDVAWQPPTLAGNPACGSPKHPGRHHQEIITATAAAMRQYVVLVGGDNVIRSSAT
jgi:hypothetical protein